MNLLQIKQKMFELGISERYMADACGVGERYLIQCLNGNKSHPISNVLQKKIENLFHTLDIRKAKEERVGLKEVFEPEPSPTMVYGPDVDRRNKEKEEEEQKKRYYKQCGMYNPILDMANGLFKSYGYSRHTTEFELDDAVVSVDIRIVRKED